MRRGDRAGTSRSRIGALLIAGTLILVACDEGGPGALTGRASGDALGAVLLEVQGTGIQGFSGRGATRVYSAAKPNEPDAYRLILVDPQGGELGFEIAVDDVGMEGPIVTVIQAARGDNTPMSPSGVAVSIER